jgi:DNA modification methylase
MPKIGWSPSKDIQVIHGDCREILPKLKEQSSFIFADPPFNIGQKYEGYKDKVSEIDYVRFTWVWIGACWDCCKGVMALHGNDTLCFMYHDVMKPVSRSRIAWINWHYRFGQCNRSNWIDARCHCLIYAKHEEYTWNPEEVLVPSDRATTYNDKRIDETENGGMRLPFSMWGVEIDNNPEEWMRPVGEETARPIPTHPGYFATWEGGIISRKSGKSNFIGQSLHKGGYLRCHVVDFEGKEEKKSVHVLVCSAFHGERPEGMVVRHLNGVHTDNCADNLKWGTPKENAEDRVLHGTQYHPIGELHPRAKVNQEAVDLIRESVTSGAMTQAEAARTFSLSPAQISRIMNGTRWMPGQVFGTKADENKFGRVQGNNRERRAGHPNQLPEAYLTRLIKAYTNPGDLVLDPFAGSGTTAVVCQKLGRRCITIDISLENVRSVQERLALVNS